MQFASYFPGNYNNSLYICKLGWLGNSIRASQKISIIESRFPRRLFNFEFFFHFSRNPISCLETERKIILASKSTQLNLLQAVPFPSIKKTKVSVQQKHEKLDYPWKLFHLIGQIIQIVRFSVKLPFDWPEKVLVMKPIQGLFFCWEKFVFHRKIEFFLIRNLIRYSVQLSTKRPRELFPSHFSCGCFGPIRSTDFFNNFNHSIEKFNVLSNDSIWIN
jgi:hypothetical protein